MESWIVQLINDLFTRTNPDPTGVNPLDDAKNRQTRFPPRYDARNDPVVTQRINADLSGQLRPREGMNGILEMIEAADREKQRQ